MLLYSLQQAVFYYSSTKKDVTVVGRGKEFLDCVENGRKTMNTSLQVQFCGIRLENPCLLSSASPTQSKEGIAKAFKLGWTVPKLVAREQLNMNWAVRSTVVAPEACMQCAKCIVACQESGKAAIRFVSKKVTIERERCDGCSLCTHVCPCGVLALR